MLPPNRCFGCGRPLSQKLYEDFDAIKRERDPDNETSKKIGIITYTPNISYADFFEKKGIRRICCKTMLTTMVRLDDKIS
jgi:DNA-directed RNA polymerase subunit N (RpoN/RPB10)